MLLFVGIIPVRSTKQVIVVRKDLNMRKGKIAAQVAHASMAVLLQQMHPQQPCGAGAIAISRTLYTTADDPMELWLSGNFTKICVSVDSEEELVNLYQMAQINGLPCSLITDSGKTEFNGVPTKTCVAIGPAFIDDVNELTGHLSLL